MRNKILISQFIIPTIILFSITFKGVYPYLIALIELIMSMFIPITLTIIFIYVSHPLHNRLMFLKGKPASRKSHKQIVEGTILTGILTLLGVVELFILLMLTTLPEKVIMAFVVAITRSICYHKFMIKKKEK